MEVFQFTLNTSLLNCFLSDTCRCWGWRWWCWLIPHSPHGTGSGSIPALQEGKWYNVVDAVSAFPLCFPVLPTWPPCFNTCLCDVGVLCWNFPSAPMHGFPVLIFYVSRRRWWWCAYRENRCQDMSCGFVSTKLWLLGLYTREFLYGLNFSDRGVDQRSFVRFELIHYSYVFIINPRTCHLKKF